MLSVVIRAAFGAIIGRYPGNPRVRAASGGSMAALPMLSLLLVFS